jgi:hypothetical protein
MKVHRLVVTGLACAIAQAAAGSSIDATQLAGITAAVEACEKVDKGVGARVEEAGESLLRGTSRETQATLRKASDYRSAYSQYVQAFGSLGRDALVRLCADAAARPSQLPRAGEATKGDKWNPGRDRSH